MHAVIGRVQIKPERADEALAMIGDRGAAMLQGMSGSSSGTFVGVDVCEVIGQA
jgi:hypothetical protein